MSAPVPPIAMPLYETDPACLQAFLASTKRDEPITDAHLILQDFAADCRYAAAIQPALIGYLLPFYEEAVTQAVRAGNRIACEIYETLSAAIFLNRNAFLSAVGPGSFGRLIARYRRLTLQKMENPHARILGWVSLFNTTVALAGTSLQDLLPLILAGGRPVRYAFFRYLSVLLFEESDNLLAINETGPFWTSDIWRFDGGLWSGDFFWPDAPVQYFDRAIGRKAILAAYAAVKPYLHELFGPETVRLLAEEMDESLRSGMFQRRKAEFLQKISRPNGGCVYWDATF